MNESHGLHGGPPTCVWVAAIPTPAPQAFEVPDGTIQDPVTSVKAYSWGLARLVSTAYPDQLTLVVLIVGALFDMSFSLQHRLPGMHTPKSVNGFGCGAVCQLQIHAA
jgi:hypothetical protein